ncbi:hypothetical protein [Streptomyces sclerotialus]|uniref:hypothetical protein n=1 Tax=Streptomyces sclerotialus TaxID=1957 RepID=UPI000A52623A
MQFVDVDVDLRVANMIGQHGTARRGRTDAPVRYEAIAQALEEVGSHCLQWEASVHMPRIGCGLAGGSWDQILPLLHDHLARRGVPVTVYDPV